MSDTTTLLWTGGWDSTFRLLQLLLIEKKNVQPIYVIDNFRRSLQREMESMHAISEMLRERLDPNVIMYPRIVFFRSDFPENRELKERYMALRERYHAGTQYYWLALVAENQNWKNVELSLEKYENGPSELQKAIFKDLDKDQPTLNSSWEAELLKYWSFPLLSTTKSQMRAIAEEHGFFEILQKRWFCLTPVRGKCCGSCRPCGQAIAAGATTGVEFIHPLELKARTWLRKIRR